MKKHITYLSQFALQSLTGIFFLSLILMSNVTHGQSWIKVDSITNSASSVAIALNKSGIPYVFLEDWQHFHKGTVVRDSSGVAVYVGAPGFTAGSILSPCIAISNSGTIYVAYRDSGNSNHASVMKYDGTHWVNVGSAGFSIGRIYVLTLVVSKNDTPYVSYSDLGDSSKLCIMKFNGSSWTALRRQGLTDSSYNEPSLAFDKAGTLYMAYGDRSVGSKMTVMKYTGIWTAVGTPGFSGVTSNSAHLVIDKNDTLFISYNTGLTFMVRKFNGSKWDTMGYWGNSVASTSLAVNNNGIPYVACIYTVPFAGVDQQPCVIYYKNGNFWLLGNGYISNKMCFGIDMAMDSSGTPYVVYLNDEFRPLIMKCAYGNGVSELGAGGAAINIHPNPSNGQFIVTGIINNHTPHAHIQLINMVGQIISDDQIDTNKGLIHTVISKGNLAQGVYLVKVIAGSETYFTKVVIDR